MNRRVLIIISIIALGMFLTLMLSSVAYPCLIIAGATYRSTNLIEDPWGNLAPSMIYFGGFAEREFHWVRSDVVMVGTYECKLGNVVARDLWSSRIPLRLHAGGTAMTWDGSVYYRTFP